MILLFLYFDIVIIFILGHLLPLYFFYCYSYSFSLYFFLSKCLYVHLSECLSVHLSLSLYLSLFLGRIFHSIFKHPVNLPMSVCLFTSKPNFSVSRQLHHFNFSSFSLVSRFGRSINDNTR